MELPLCPQCRQLDQLVAVPALVRGGTWQSQTIGGHLSTIGRAGALPATAYGMSLHQSTGASEMARLLSPPPQPVKPISMWLVGAFLLFMCGLGVALPALMGDSLTLHIILLICVSGIVACVVGEVASHPIRQRELAEKTAIWQQQISVWNRLSYCNRCDLVSDPQSGNTRRSGSWPDLLG